MSRELLLLRHGKSDWDVDVDDFHRPLKERGKRGAQRVGIWLLKQDLIPDLVVSSPAERALTTAEKCCKTMGMNANAIEQDRKIYDASPSGLLEVLANCPPEAKRVMLVGHNPGMEQLLCELADPPPETPEDGKLMPTATLARLSMPDEWSELGHGVAKLLQLVRGADLPKKFPYPSPDGSEERDRPAYYYTQSSVIPYRMTDAGVEVLIVRSSQDKHWVIPKGIADPGLTLQESAAKEAWEEAGVEGRVHEQAIGSYSYPKWGATCTVSIYPMEVTRLLPQDQWEEHHRGRRWVSAAEAAEMLNQAELVPMVLALEAQLTKG
jgi:phosphohistidine phosphatase